MKYSLNKEVLKEALKERGMSYNKLATELGIEQCVISQWCSGNKGISVNNLFKTADILEMNVYDLLKVEDVDY